MAGETSHYGLQKLEAGDPFSTSGYKFTSKDREQIDRLLYLGAEGHRHTGADSELEGPTQAPSLTLFETGGTIPAGSRVFYKYTLVDEDGNESSGSPEGYIDTAPQVDDPNPPSLVASSAGGTLQPGNYYYVLSAYTNAYTQETKATNPSYITVPVGTVTNSITVTMPTAPVGADGFNIYRKRPGTANYLYLASVTSVTPSFLDDGSTAEDCNRVLPARNTTNATNAIRVCLPGATPAVPAGYTWRVYRTYITSNYEQSFLWHITEESSPGIISPCYDDVGNATTAGAPPLTDQGVGSPSKIDLEGESEGQLPMGRTSFPYVETFGFFGTLELTVGTSTWVCPFPAATIIFCRAALGRGFAPAASEVIVDVNKGTGATPTYTTIYTTQANRPRISVGTQIGTKKHPDIRTLVEGDSLTVDIDQVGGGATPTDKDLTVMVYMIVHGYPDDIAYVPGTTTGSGA